MLFEQVNGVEGADFSEMRAYMLSKIDVESGIRHRFLNEIIHEWILWTSCPLLISIQKNNGRSFVGFQNSFVDIWILPFLHKDGMLNEYLLKTYNELFDQAEAAVEKDTKILKRVRAARLPLQYAELEIMRTTLKGDRDDLASKVELFRTRTMEAWCQSFE